MIPNLLNTVVGLVLAYSIVLHPVWIEQRFFPLLPFAAAVLVLALWARRSDPHPWFSWVNITLAVALAILSLLPLATLPFLAFWGVFWAGCAIPVVALWSALYQRDLARHAPEAAAKESVA